MVLSKESKNGFPIPASSPTMAHSTIPPIESPSILYEVISSLISSILFVSITGSSLVKSSSKSSFFKFNASKEESLTFPTCLI